MSKPKTLLSLSGIGGTPLSIEVVLDEHGAYNVDIHTVASERLIDPVWVFLDDKELTT